MHFIGGALMGLAGSLHCAGLCGGIASSLLLATEAPDGAPAARAARLLKVQLGRALSYTLCGAMVGGGGAAFAGLINLAGIQPMTRIAAACALVWTGCSVAGLVPSFAILDRVMASTFNSWPVAVTRQFQNPHPVVLGILWGFAPCGMVYAALFNAILSGSSAAGASFMAGLGLATIPAVAMAAFGVTALAGFGARLPRSKLRAALGTALLTLGLASLVEPAASFSALCLGR
jgi:sulfite exporter TauE/SafE